MLSLIRHSKRGVGGAKSCIAMLSLGSLCKMKGLVANRRLLKQYLMSNTRSGLIIVFFRLQGNSVEEGGSQEIPDRTLTSLLAVIMSQLQVSSSITTYHYHLYTFPPPRPLLTNTTSTAAYLDHNHHKSVTIYPHRPIKPQATTQKVSNSRSRTTKDLRPPRIGEETHHASEKAREQHNHAETYFDALVGDGGEAYDGADEEDGAEHDGDHSAGSLDAVGGEVVEPAFSGGSA